MVAAALRTPRRPARLDAALLHEPAALSEVWARGWAGFVERVGSHFARAQVRAHVAAYLKGLLSPIERKNSWQFAEAVGDPTPYAMQHLLSRARWDPDAVRDDLRAYVVEHLGHPTGVLAIDETGFLQMLQRALEAGVPAAWVVGDEVYGDDSKLRRWLEEREQPYVLAVSSQHRIWTEWRQIMVRELLQQVPADAWHRTSSLPPCPGFAWRT